MLIEIRAYALCKIEELDEDCCKLGLIEKKVRREEWRTIEHWISLTHDKIEQAQAREKMDLKGLDKMVARLRPQAGALAFGWMENLV